MQHQRQLTPYTQLGVASICTHTLGCLSRWMSMSCNQCGYNHWLATHGNCTRGAIATIDLHPNLSIAPHTWLQWESIGDAYETVVGWQPLQTVWQLM